MSNGKRKELQKVTRLGIIAAQEFFRLRRKEDRPKLIVELSNLFRDVIGDATDDDRRRVRALLNAFSRKPLRAPPPELVNWIREHAGRQGLTAWIRLHGPPIGDPNALPALVEEWIGAADDSMALLEAAIRFAANRATRDDRRLIELAFEQFQEKEKPMVNFTFDPRGLPAGFDRAAYKARVDALLENTFGLPPDGNENTYGAIIGILLLNEQLDQNSVTFRDAVQEAWNETLAEVVSDPAQPRVSSRVAYNRIAAVLAANNLVPLVDDEPQISHQQFAAAARYVISKSEDVWLEHPSLPTQVRLGLDQYVGGAPLFDTLDLPPLGDDAQIVGDNVRAVATIAACGYLERARLIDVLDSIVAEFGVGKVPIGFDAAGRALDAYRTIPREQLLSPAERQAVYSRVLGFAGGDVPKDVMPNREWETLLGRFIASIAEYDRQRRLNDIFANQARPLAFTGELVRKAGNDLARNASLYGYAGTQFDARRIAEMVQTALKILSIQSLQRAYGVTNAYQMMERIAASNLGQTISVVKYKTLAESVKALLDIIAKYSTVWSRTAGTPLFSEGGRAGDIRDADRDTLFNQVQYYLAVTGTNDDTVEKLAQPVEAKAAPSIPMLSGGTGSADAGAIDKIRQMVSSGQPISPADLNNLLPAMRA